MKTTTPTEIRCPNCNKLLEDVGVGQTFGNVRKRITFVINAHLPRCKHRGAALTEFARMYGTAGNVATLATLFKLLHDDEITRAIQK